MGLKISGLQISDSDLVSQIQLNIEAKVKNYPHTKGISNLK